MEPRKTAKQMDRIVCAVRWRLRPSERWRQLRRAAILVLTLWMIVVLGMISASMLEETHLELRLAQFQRSDFEALCLARAGLAKAIADLRNDLEMDRTRQSEMFDALGDIWARGDEGKLGRNNEGIEMGRGRFWVWIEDETAKLDLNTVAMNHIMLQALLQEVGLKPKEVAEVAAAILDYRDPDDMCNLPPATGKEEEYYSKQRRTSDNADSDGDPKARPTYRCKNDRFSTVEELLYVHGVTPQLYYGVDPEKEELPDPIQQTLARLDAARSPRARERKIGLRDLLTVRNAPTVNINTAPAEVLRVVLRAATHDPKMSEQIANNIVLMRKPDARGNYSNEGAFKNVAELAKVAGMPVNLIPQMMTVAPLSVRSDHYRIWSLGESGKSRRLICALVQRSLEICQPEQLFQLYESGAVRARLAERFYRRYGRDRNPIEQYTVRVVQWQEY
ncbi:MAG: general secretion pathway protein GspK [Candidatus Sumerlaeia bacterium]|nr:general secretion pathway protein GspK [Candidatus Sumerlaeia bacterium]